MATRAFSPRGTPLGSTQRVLPQTSVASSSASRPSAGPGAVGGVAANRVQQTRVNTQMPTVTPQKRTPDDEASPVPGQAHGLAAVAQIEEEPLPLRGGSTMSAMSGQEPMSMRPSTESTPEERSTEDQIRGERLWWSENTSLQVRKMSFQMQQELEKAIAALNDRFREQLDIERQHRQAIFGEVKKELSSQRVALTEVEHRGEQGVDSSNAALAPHMSAISDCLNEANNVREEVLRSSSQLRQELESQEANQRAVLSEVAAERERQELRVSSLEAALADIRRDLIMQQAVVDNLRQDASVHADLRHNLAAQQAAINDLRRDFGASGEIRRTEQEAAERHIDDLDGKIKKLSLSISQTEAKLTTECTSIRSSMTDRLEESQRHLASVASEAANSKSLDVSRSRIDMLEAKLSELAGELGGRFNEVEGVREEMNRFAQQLSDEKVERARAIAGVCEHAEEVVQHGLNDHRKDESPAGAKLIQGLQKKLEAEITERAQLAAVVADVRVALLDVLRIAEEEKERTAEQQRSAGENAEDLRRVVEEAKASNIQDINQINGRLSDLTTVVDQLQALHAADVADLRAHVAEAMSRTQSLAADGAPVEATQELTQALTSLRTALEEEREKSTAVRNLFLEGGGKRTPELQGFLLAKEKGDDVGSQSTGSTELNANGLVSQIRALGTSLQSELGTRLDLVSGVMLKRLEQVEADVSGDLLRRLEQLEADVRGGLLERLERAEADFGGASSHLLRRLEAVESGMDKVQAGSGAMDPGTLESLEILESRVQQLESCSSNQEEEDEGRRQAAQEQRSEILALTRIITGGTEKLAERIASESAMWRSSKLQSEARFNYIEKIIGGMTGDGSHVSEPEATISEPELPPLMSEDLKDTLETLVSKLNKTLKPAEPETQRSSSLGLSPGPTLGLNPSAISQGLPRGTSRERSTSRGPQNLAGEFTRRSASPGRPTSTDTGLRPFVRGNPTFISGSSAGVQRAVSLHGNTAGPQRDSLSNSLSNTAGSGTGSVSMSAAAARAESAGNVGASGGAKHLPLGEQRRVGMDTPHSQYRLSGVAGSHPHSQGHTSPTNSTSSHSHGGTGSQGGVSGRGTGTTPKMRHSGTSGR